jgi:recombination protein RecA
MGDQRGMEYVVDIEEIMAKLPKETRARVQAANEIIIEKMPTPSVAMNLALKGGFGYGRQTLIWGNKSSGKSSFCLEMIAKAQKEGKVCAWIDVEHSFDKSWAEKLGVDTEALIISQVKATEDMVDVATKLIESGVDVLVVDSISSLLSSAFFDKNDEMKDLGDTKQIGSDARDMANAVRMINYVNKKTAVVLISQIRNKIHTYGASPSPTGGEAVKFFSSTSIRLTSTPREDDQIKGEVMVGDKLFGAPVGRKVHWTIEFNKLGPPSTSSDYDFYYDGDHIGVDALGETLDLAEKFGLVAKKGAWYTVDGAQVQGRTKAVNMLREQPDLYERMVKELNEQIS